MEESLCGLTNGIEANLKRLDQFFGIEASL